MNAMAAIRSGHIDSRCEKRQNLDPLGIRDMVI